MVDTQRKTAPLKLSVPLSMYESMYMRDYRWYKDYETLSNEDIKKLQIADSQLKAKEFAQPREEQVEPYGDSLLRERTEVIPAPPKECYRPQYYPATDLAITQMKDLERLQYLPEPENKLCYCQHCPAAGTADMLLNEQYLDPSCATYRHFILQLHQASLRDSQQNRSKSFRSSVLKEEFPDLDWRSTYMKDYQRCPGVYGGICRGNQNLSHIFPKDGYLNLNYWVSEYKDSYSISLQKLNLPFQYAVPGLCSELCTRNGMTMDITH